MPCESCSFIDWPRCSLMGESSERFARLGPCCTRRKCRNNLYLVFYIFLVVVEDQAPKSCVSDSVHTLLIVVNTSDWN